MQEKLTGFFPRSKIVFPADCVKLHLSLLDYTRNSQIMKLPEDQFFVEDFF